MFTNLIGLLITLTIAAGAFWLLNRVRRNPDKRIKWGGSAGLGFVGVLASIFAILVVLGMWTIYTPRATKS